jgi:hypothetical protein
VAATEGVPVLLVGCLAARAHLLARLGRHAEAAEASRRQRACAERLDSPAMASTAAHDAGLVAIAAGDLAAAAALLGEALTGDGTGFSRPTAGLHRAEALAELGDPDAATDQLRAAMMEPAGRADQPWTLLHDPARFPDWWAGIGTVATGPDGGYTMWPTGYPDFPMPQQLRAEPGHGGVTISCLVSDLVFRWRLRADGEATDIAVEVDIPEAEAHRVPDQRRLIEKSLAALAELAARS